MRFLVLALALACGCRTTLADIEDAATASEVVADKLHKCRNEARDAFYVEHKSEKAALAVYDACKKREGL